MLSIIEKGFAHRSRLFAAKGKTLAQMTRPAAAKALPAPKYCKRAKKAGVDELMARYAGGASARTASAESTQSDDNGLPGVALSYAAGRVNEKNARLLPGKKTKVAKKTKVKKANGKVDWAKVMNALLGPRIRAYEPIPVNVGVPKGAKKPVYPSIATGALPEVASVTGDGDVTPLPTPKPGRVAASVPARGTAKPGSIVILPPIAADGTRTPLVRPAPIQ